ncbi:alpha/beta fold hydrolase [Nocardiopsis coralliicola]
MSAPFRLPGLVVTDHTFSVPLDHAAPGGARIPVFAREVAAPGGEDRPYLLFLQGGPGQEAPRPTGSPAGPGWLSRALADYRVLLLDQRGTGLSAPIGAGLPGTPEEQADYLALFRADSIVADAEWIRAELGIESWSVLGQSFGGFCTLHYLSAAPHALRAAFFTGGLPPVGRHPDEVYRATFDRMRRRTERHYRQFPEDRAHMEALSGRLAEQDVRLPNGDRLTPRRLRQIGHLLGKSDGGETVHYLLERGADSPAFIADAAAAMPFSGRNPLYAAIHESCYADGSATRWSAQRTLPDDFAADPALLTGEHVFPWMFEEEGYGELAPLGAAAELLAEREWPRLYDAGALAACTVPCAAAIYADDVYVERAFSEETAALLPSLRPWITNEFDHNGLNAGGPRVLDRLIALVDGTV